MCKQWKMSKYVCFASFPTHTTDVEETQRDTMYRVLCFEAFNTNKEQFGDIARMTWNYKDTHGKEMSQK